jgi:hypothetical protein
MNIKIVCSIAAAFVCLNSVRADSATLVPSADTWIFAEAPDNNMGASVDFAVGVNAHGSAMRALMKFGFSTIPVNAVVTSVTVSVTAYKGNVIDDTTFVLHRLLQDWVEGEGNGNTGSPAAPGWATWNDRINSTNSWSAPGAAPDTDYDATASGSIVVNTLQTYTFPSTTKLVSDVQGWIANPLSNFGWLFKADAEGGQSARRWFSHDNLSGGPSLTINYTVPPAPPVISNVGRNNNQIHFSFSAQTNRTYAVEARGSLSSGSWAAVSNYSASAVATNFNFFAVTSSNQFYRVRTP